MLPGKMTRYGEGLRRHVTPRPSMLHIKQLASGHYAIYDGVRLAEPLTPQGGVRFYKTLRRAECALERLQNERGISNATG